MVGEFRRLPRPEDLTLLLGEANARAVELNASNRLKDALIVRLMEVIATLEAPEEPKKVVH